MDKINFKDLQAQYINRYKLNPVTGQTDTYDITPIRGTVTQEGTPVRALELNQMQQNIENDLTRATQSEVNTGSNTTKLVTPATLRGNFATQSEAETGTNSIKLMSPLRTAQQFISNSAALIPTVAGNSTTRDLTVPTGNNTNRITIIPSAVVTANSAIRLRVGTGSYYNIRWSGTTANINQLNANTPYDLVFNGSAWISINHTESGSNANGSWTKRSDGTLEITHSVSDGSIAANASVTKTWTFPVPFSLVPKCFGNISSSASNDLGAVHIDDSTTASCRVVLTNKHTATLPWAADLFAIGRWY